MGNVHVRKGSLQKNEANSRDLNFFVAMMDKGDGHCWWWMKEEAIILSD